MSYTVAINSSGQATIPKAVRNILGLIPNENRLTFNIVDGQVILSREPSRREMLEASLEKIAARNKEAEKRNPEIKKLRKKYQGMTFDEVRDAYDATPEGKKEFEEKYGIKL